MGFKIITENGVPKMLDESDPTIATDMLLSVTIEQGAFFQNPKLGLRKLPNKNAAGSVKEVEDRFAEALKWLTDSRRAKKMDVSAVADGNDRARVTCEAKQQNEQPVKFETFAGVI